jgi:hypothetical protein
MPATPPDSTASDDGDERRRLHARQLEALARAAELIDVDVLLADAAWR